MCTSKVKNVHVLSENNGNNSENEREEVFIIQGKNDATLSLPLEGKWVYIHALRGNLAPSGAKN